MIIKTIDYGFKYSALLLSKSECGDVGLIKQLDNDILVALIDGLGHGAEARRVASLAKEYINKNDNIPLNQMIKGMHNYLKGTRGLVVAILKLHIQSGDFTFCGIGNITCKVLGSNPKTLLSRDGVVGYTIATPITKNSKLEIGDILILHSDGISSHFDINIKDKWSFFLAQEIAEDMITKYRNTNDDASCIVLRYM